MTDVVSAGEARRRIALDHRVLREEVARHPADALTAPYDVAGGPIGDSCESLRDLIAHVLMWDEINLALLSEADKGRLHWSLDPNWEDAEVGRALNAAGVAAGRELPVDLLLHRLDTVCAALLTELGSYSDDQWNAAAPVDLEAVSSLGSLAQYAMTVPGAAPYCHASLHLRRVNDVVPESVDTAPRGAPDSS